MEGAKGKKAIPIEIMAANDLVVLLRPFDELAPAGKVEDAGLGFGEHPLGSSLANEQSL